MLRAATDVEVAATSNQGELDGVLHRRGGRQVVVAGGDGSLHAVVAALHRRHELADTVVGLVPLGTGNDFARGVGIPLDPEEAARLVVDGQRPARRPDRRLPRRGRRQQRARRRRRPGQPQRARTSRRCSAGSATSLGALKAAVKPPFVRLRIEVDDHVVADFAHPILMVAIGNGSRVGGGRRDHPGGRPRGRQARRDGVVLDRRRGPSSGTPSGSAAARHHERDDVLYLRATGSASRGRTSTAAPTASSTAPSATAPGTSSRARSRCRCPSTVGPRSDPAAADRLDAGLEPRVGAELVASAPPPGGAPCAR